VRFRRPQDAAAAGFGVVHQEQSLLTNLSVAENIAMNALSSKDNATKGGWYRWGQLNREAETILARVGAKIDPRSIVGDISFVDRQMVEIARALRVDEMTHATPIVILDEPTSVLERNETAILEREIADLKNIGSVIFVSHRLDEVLRICDRIVVMRSGKVVADRSTEAVTEDELFQLMIGHAARATKSVAADRTVARGVRDDPQGRVQERGPHGSAWALCGTGRHPGIRPRVVGPGAVRRRAVRLGHLLLPRQADRQLVGRAGHPQRHGLRAGRAEDRGDGRRHVGGREPGALP
jgi:ABC-type sugar transport system ATPase subunit